MLSNVEFDVSLYMACHYLKKGKETWYIVAVYVYVLQYALFLIGFEFEHDRFWTYVMNKIVL